MLSTAHTVVIPETFLKSMSFIQILYRYNVYFMDPTHLFKTPSSKVYNL